MPAPHAAFSGSPVTSTFGKTMKKVASRCFSAFVIFTLSYLVGAFVVTPPYSLHGFYSVPGCACGHHSFATIEGDKLYIYTATHNVRKSLGSITDTDGTCRLSTPKLPPITLRFTFWGCFASEHSGGKTSFYPRDYFYPISILTKLKTQKSEQDGPPNDAQLGSFKDGQA